MVYEYKCKECGEYLEYELTMEDRYEPCNQPCPICGAVDCVEKVILSAPGITFRFMGSTIQSRLPTPLKEKFKQIKKCYGSDKCKGID